MKQIRFTKQGLEKLQRDYEEIKSQRKFAVDDLQKARAMGDLSENGYYKAARQKLSFIDSQIRRFTATLKQAIVIEGQNNSQYVDIGSMVTLISGNKEVVYNIVGDLESEPSKRKISLLSPIGIAIAGKKVGEKVEIVIPSGKITYTIKKIF